MSRNCPVVFFLMVICAASGCASLRSTWNNTSFDQTTVTGEAKEKKSEAKNPSGDRVIDKQPVILASFSEHGESVPEEAKAVVGQSTPSNRYQQPRLVDKLWSDQVNFYTRSNWKFATASIGVAATLAHTDIDQDFRNWWQDDFDSLTNDSFIQFTNSFGDGRMSLSVVGSAAIIGTIAGDAPWADATSEWGFRSLRSYAAGVPALLFLQLATGASRPGETSAESDWVPFHDDNGASGHAFMGAVPFICAAQMTENPLLTTLCYSGSVATAVSRIDTDFHYLSQVILGWSVALLACDAVTLTESESKNYSLVPLVSGDGTVGIAVEYLP